MSPPCVTFGIAGVDMSTGYECVYKLDRRTGNLWLVTPGRAVQMENVPRQQKNEPPEENAIALAKFHLAPGSSSSMDNTIQSWLESHKGELRVYGWKPTKIDDQTYLVVYSFDEGPGSSVGGWAFEVNLKAQIVRPVMGDAALEKNYHWKEGSAKQ